jgi:putative IMPACT (imprinted ancient) family translation regulator
VVTDEPYLVYELRSGYSEYQKYSNILTSASAIIDDTDFGADVCVKFALKRDEAERVLKRISEAGFGRDIPTLLGERFDCR